MSTLQQLRNYCLESSYIQQHQQIHNRKYTSEDNGKRTFLCFGNLWTLNPLKCSLGWCIGTDRLEKVENAFYCEFHVETVKKYGTKWLKDEFESTFFCMESACSLQREDDHEYCYKHFKN